jgi:phosphopantothenoylcysteine decarboxylase/phosphopantothenate--cysteine ligase
MEAQTLRVLVTSGPTWEFIDDVRYIASPSSGRMGAAVVEVFAAAAHDVVLVTGPTHLPPIEGIHCIKVTSALDMQREVSAHLHDVDVVVAAAAVADYRVSERFEGKRKRTGEKLILELVENPDILGEIGEAKGDRILVGFALESSERREGALAKLRKKNLDMIVLNGPEAFGVETTSVEIIEADERTTVLEGVSKRQVAEQILQMVERICQDRPHQQ